MQKLHYSISIDASKQKVWKVMLDDKSYREWTAVFNPGSYFKGDWSEGSKMLFIGPDPETGREGGMVARIAQNKPYEFISIEHQGIIKNGIEDTTSEEAKKWAPAYENYTFIEKDGSTELKIDMDVMEEYIEMFNKMWLEALSKLKAKAEETNAITVQTVVNAPIEKVWEYWTTPEHITRWAFATDTWEAPEAENDIRTGGKFKTVMAAKDGSSSFDFSGTYTDVDEHKLIKYVMDDGRSVSVIFEETPEGTKMVQTFDPESTNSLEMQRDGWQAILDNFKKHVETSKN